VVGYTNVATDFTITTNLTKGAPPPTAQAFVGDFVNAQGVPVDFDGNITLQWQPVDGATAYEVERSGDGVNYSFVASLSGSQTAMALNSQPSGQLSYRVRALTPGQIGSYVTGASNVVSVIVDPRGKVDITSQVATAMSNVTFTGGVFKMDLNLRNNSASAYVPLVELKVIGITSTSGTVSVKNADNGGNGKSVATAALFGYSNLLGADQEFGPAEITGNRNLEFNDSASEMFSFDVAVTAFQRGAGGGASGAAAPGGDSGSASPSGSGTTLQSLTKVLRITVNPLTRTVTARLL
jgi:hypothetical protein